MGLRSMQWPPHPPMAVVRASVGKLAPLVARPASGKPRMDRQQVDMLLHQPLRLAGPTNILFIWSMSSVGSCRCAHTPCAVLCDPGGAPHVACSHLCAASLSAHHISIVIHAQAMHDAGAMGAANAGAPCMHARGCMPVSDPPVLLGMLCPMWWLHCMPIDLEFP